MSKLGKIFLWIALVGVLASVGAGVKLNLQYKDTQTNLANESAAKAAALSDAAKQKALAEKTALALAESEQSLKSEKAKSAQLDTDLAAAKQKADEAQKAADQAVADGKKAADDLKAINDKLQGKTIDEIVAARAKAEADFASAQAEQKILTDQVQEAQAKVKQLMADINASKVPYIPPGVSGKVTFVNHTWNFVVIDVGLSNGVVPNGQLIVYRKNNFLGKVKVTTADANSAVADILPDAKGDIQVGDYVLN